MKKFFLLLVVFVFLMWGTNSQTFAQPTASADGLFGEYFQRIVKPCEPGHNVVTGFSALPYGAIICKWIEEVLKNIPNGTRVEIGQTGGNVDVVVNGKITQTQQSSVDDPKAVVTVGMLNEILKTRMPNIHMDYATGKGYKHITFPEGKFKTTPSVIVMPTGFSRWASCERIRWEFFAQPKNVTKDGFSFDFQFANRGCGGLHLHTIAYIAIGNIDSAPLSIVNPVAMFNMEEDSNEEGRIAKLEKEIVELKKMAGTPLFVTTEQAAYDTWLGTTKVLFKVENDPKYEGTIRMGLLQRRPNSLPQYLSYGDREWLKQVTLYTDIHFKNWEALIPVTQLGWNQAKLEYIAWCSLNPIGITSMADMTKGWVVVFTDASIIRWWERRSKCGSSRGAEWNPWARGD